MPNIHVEKSVTIHAPAAKLIELLKDFDQWIPWSPWLLMEPEAKVDVKEDKHHYSWDGDRVGAGNMTYLDQSTQTNKTTLFYDLKFLKPFKSEADVSFVLEDMGEDTLVTWTMDSKLPFFLFWMKKMMIAYVGMDYQRGLNMLKEYVELGHINSHLVHKGKTDASDTLFVGIRKSCETQDIDASMSAVFTELEEFQAKHLNDVDGLPFCIYHKWDIVKGQAQYSAALPMKNIPDDLPEHMYTSSMPSHKAYVLEHTGDYKHLGNAWSTLYTMERNKELSCAKGIDPYEVYKNSPVDTDLSKLKTEVCFPVKN